MQEYEMVEEAAGFDDARDLADGRSSETRRWRKLLASTMRETWLTDEAARREDDVQ